MTTTPCGSALDSSDCSFRFSRSRIRAIAIAFLVVAAGLGSRRYAASLPLLIARYGGDTMWALLVYLLLGIVWPSLRVCTVALFTGAISLADELSQLYHAPWIDALRRTWLGGIVLGFGFL